MAAQIGSETQAAALPGIAVIDVRRGGPPAHAALARERMTALRDACLSAVPGMGMLAPVLDRVSSAWLARTPSPYLDEIAAIAKLIRGGGVWFVNASYEWGCTARVDDFGAAPVLWRTLDWPFRGLGCHVEVALQDGGAGVYANVTWPGAVGVLTAVAPGRFAAAINQAPLLRRTRALALVPCDIVLNAAATWRLAGCWPAAHLLRRVFDTCASFEDAVAVLAAAPVARPTLYSVAGPLPTQACLIERNGAESVVRRGSFAIANDWHPDGPRRQGRWMPRGSLARGLEDSEHRRRQLEGEVPGAPFSWLQDPVLNAFTRIAVEASASTGRLLVRGFEPARGWRTAVPATAALEIVVATAGTVETRPATSA